MFRAKLKVDSVELLRDENDLVNANLVKMSAVPASEYPENGEDENNTFAMFTPSADLSMTISNPSIKVKIGQEFYVDFTLLGTLVSKEELAAANL